MNAILNETSDTQLEIYLQQIEEGVGQILLWP